MSTTPRTALPLLAAAQAQKHVTHNDALLQLDTLLFARFLDRDLTAPPSSPADGDTYLVHATATGAWTGQSGKIAYASSGAWRFAAPFTGLAAYVVDESKLIVFTGSAWADYASILVLQNVPLLGVNTTADTTNKLAVKSSALLFDNIGNGVQAKLNKNASGDTASLLYQTGYSGRAEIGLTGDDDFHFKVSADGATWFEGLKIAKASGLVTLPIGQLAFPATQNPSSDANTLDDYEEGTFTPVLTSSSTPPTGVTYASQVGEYVKIGTLVWISAKIVLTNAGSGGSGNARIGGLPFAARNTANQTYNGGTLLVSVTLSSGYSQTTSGAVPGSSTVGFSQIGSGLALAGIPLTQVANTSTLGCTSSYPT